MARAAEQLLFEEGFRRVSSKSRTIVSSVSFHQRVKILPAERAGACRNLEEDAADRQLVLGLGHLTCRAR